MKEKGHPMDVPFSLRKIVFTREYLPFIILYNVPKAGESVKLIYKGKYQSEADLPVRSHPKGSVPFREPGDLRKLALLLNGMSIPLWVLTVGIFIWCALPHLADGVLLMNLGIWTSLLLLFPHELLHALCFKGEVELWTNLKMGMLFVVGTEDMSKGRFVFLSLLPNLVFGWIPYLLFLACPQWIFFGALGAMSIPMGIGDYYNVYNCLTQVPKGAAVYMSGMNSYWYLPKGVRHGEE